MSLTVTVVHAPGAVSSTQWKRLREEAPGAYDHELRLRLAGTAAFDTVEGAEIDKALRTALELPPTVQLSTGGILLADLPAGSDRLHPGMVVLLAPEGLPLRSPRHTLGLCVDSGPDAGQLFPLRRGRWRLGRGEVDLPVADPAIARHAADVVVGSREVRWSDHIEDRPLTTEDVIERGSTRLLLSRSEPEPGGGAWPPSPEHVDQKPPEGKHRMMLAFACIPLVVGIVLVLTTGMWFFLVFSLASAAVAGGVAVAAGRRRRQYRRAVRHAARRWAQQCETALPSPGIVARRLRSPVAGPSPVETPADAVRLGRGSITAELEFSAAASDSPCKEMQVNCATGLSVAGGEVTWLRGSARDTTRLLRWMVLQLCLRNTIDHHLLIADGGTFSIPELRDLPVGRLQPHEASTPDESLAPGVAVFPLGARCATPDLSSFLRAGWHVIVAQPTSGPGVDTAPSPGLGQHSGWIVDLTARHLLRIDDAGRRHEHATDLRWDGLSAETFAELARLAVPHTATTHRTGLPTQCTVPLPGQLFTASAGKQLVAQVGRSQTGDTVLDLVSDGPHVLIAGTTGSGKSELLKTLLLSLAASYSPEELNFVLIDFKGGATFHQLGRLEHTLSVVTDLSQAQAERTLEGIRSELVRREELFLQAGAGDYTEYRQLKPQDPLARILLVIDEFRIFSHELPDTMDELMRVATLGRSLGLHLVLATQRPQGVVTADIRANIGATIALRVRSEDESRELIGTAEAAEIPRTAPGRALLRRAGEKPEVFHTAQLTCGQTLRAAPEVADPGARAHAQGAGVAELVDRLADEMSARSLRRRHSPLQPSLPSCLRITSEDQALRLGLFDEPMAQRQSPMVFTPDEPRTMALVGEAEAGGSRVLHALGRGVLSLQSTSLYILDGDHSLSDLSSHPGVGAYLTCDDLPEVDYLLTQLRARLTARRTRRSGQQAAVAATPMVLLVTAYGQWHVAGQSGPGSGMEHQLGTLIAEGPEAGLSVIVSGGRELSTGKLGGRIPTKVFLPLGVSEEVKYLWPKLRPTDPLPGRGVYLSPTTPSPGLEVQLATEAEPAEPDHRWSGPAPELHVAPLPEQLSRRELPPPRPEELSTGIMLGMTQFSREPARLRLGQVTLLLGSPGTGKTSTLEMLRNRLDQINRGQADRLRIVRITGGADWDLSHPPEILLLDDAHLCRAEQHQQLSALVSAGTRVVASALPGAGVFTQLPWAHPARTGENLVLSPTHRAETDAFAVVAPVLERPVPGRAVHLRPEGPRLIQLAL
ncbi:FtsK/SpoIIIE domain-containing protein [Nesterenkonia alba]|uniref:FtsK/SpoIIIE domain-containing protein n=1 Tax=Nesterenkonia alba TaxID=515814 RepID=UPI0003B42488|nr:FtsK/SpoIIIE domain-containing protein [Nesterenkonia alba]